MILFQLFSDPVFVLIWVVGVLYAMTVHEFGHALAAKLLGDTTPEQQGRLTLNPLAHIDSMGLLMMMLVGFGWGRPVIFDARQLKYPRLGPALVGLAGPLANLLSILVFGTLTSFLVGGGVYSPDNLMIQFFVFLILLNTTLLAFNLLPIPPLDGSHLLFALLPDRYWQMKAMLATQGPMLLLGLVFLDMVTGGSIFSPMLRWFQIQVFSLF